MANLFKSCQQHEISSRPSIECQYVKTTVNPISSYRLSLTVLFTGTICPPVRWKRLLWRHSAEVSAQYPVHRTAQSALHFTPVHWNTNPTSLGSIQPHCNHCIIFTHISITVHSQVLTYTAELTGASWRERKFPNFETAANFYLKFGFPQLKIRRSISLHGLPKAYCLGMNLPF